jgi:hypothetical protein
MSPYSHLRYTCVRVYAMNHREAVRMYAIEARTLVPSYLRTPFPKSAYERTPPLARLPADVRVTLDLGHWTLDLDEFRIPARPDGPLSEPEASPSRRLGRRPHFAFRIEYTRPLVPS